MAKICNIAYPLELGNRRLELVKKARRVGEAKLFKRDCEWYLNISVELEELEPIKPRGIMGVDLGMRNSATIVASKPIFLKHGHLFYKITRYWERTDSLKRKLPKGKRTSKRIKRLGRKVARINDFIAHDSSAKIVKKAMEIRKAIAPEKLEVPNRSLNKKWSRRASN